MKAHVSSSAGRVDYFGVACDLGSFVKLGQNTSKPLATREHPRLLNLKKPPIPAFLKFIANLAKVQT